ncbi:MAG: phosphoglycerate dehydrogenase [Acidobacteria bacterium]|nr:phosphoglycerate dehydrogenase [Acidobacteriota bacterium]
MLSLVIPDDFPAVMAASKAYRDLTAAHTVAYYDSLPGSEETLIERIRDFEGVINIRSSSKFTERVFASCPKLKVLSLWGTGTDNVDLPAATRHGVTVTNTPGVAAVSIAEHCLMLTLAVARKIIALHNRTVAGEWAKGQSIQLNGKTLGIIGLGAIGRQFARLGQGIGMKVIAWTMNPNPALGFELVELETLLRDSDVVSVHLRQSPRTMGFLGREQLAMMKPGSILINTARGPIVDEPALIDALRSGHLAGAGLDVFDVEPLPPAHPLTRCENAVLTPHCAGITPEVLEAGLALSIENVFSYLRGDAQNVVNR